MYIVLYGSLLFILRPMGLCFELHSMVITCVQIKYEKKRRARDRIKIHIRLEYYYDVVSQISIGTGIAPVYFLFHQKLYAKGISRQTIFILIILTSYFNKL